MKKVGIITEYNPFHQGHIYHIQKSKEQGDILIAITSSYFSQRGLPSILTKSDKTRLALENGVDLVLELPMCYACQSADYFAKYAIQSLSCLDIDFLVFGSETNDIEYLKNYSQDLEQIQANPTTSLNQNINTQKESLNPNDILAIQYIKECKKNNIQPISIQRKNEFKSATQTRNDYFQGINQYNDQYFIKNQDWNFYYPYLRTFLLMTDKTTLSTFFLVNEGIENRLKENAKKYDIWNDFLNASISKTYSKARIQRTCLFMLMQITKEQMIQNDSFCCVKVLGFNKKGQVLLKEYKDKPIYTKFNQYSDFLKEVELKSRYLYNSVLENPIKEGEIIVYPH